MAVKRRIRRKVRRKTATPLPASSDKLKGQRDEAAAILVGGAKDPAERSADQMADQVLSGGTVSGATTSSPSPTPSVARKAAGTGPIASGSGSTAAPAKARTSINALSVGRSLSGPEKATFEPGFGRSFSDVRVHEGSQADRAAQSVDADAFTDGQNVVFAEGQSTPRNMAHELAHVARGDTGIRRTIETEIEGKPDNLKYKYKHDYGVPDLTRFENTYWCDKPIVGSDVNKEIATAMLASARQFDLKGKGLYRAEASLRDHHKARREIIKLAQSIRVKFSLDDSKLIDNTIKWIDDEARRRRDDEIAAHPPTGTDAEKHAKKVEIYAGHFHDVMQENAGDEKMKAAAQKAMKLSEEYDKSSDVSKERPFAAACFVTTAFTMYAAGGKLKLNDPVPFDHDEPDVKKTALWTDWVPGDWGYISNNSATPNEGEDGENIIYTGNGKFWAHYPGSTGSDTLEHLMNTVASWNGDAGSKLEDVRSFPATGLR